MGKYILVTRSLNAVLFRFIIFLLSTILCNTASGQESSDKVFMGIDLNNVLCGYSEIFISESLSSGLPIMLIEQNNYINFKTLGRDIVQRQMFSYRIDKNTGNYFYHSSYTEQGKHKMGATMSVAGDSIYICDTVNGVQQAVYLPEGTVLQNTIFYPEIARELGINQKDSVTYSIFDLRSGKVREIVYRKLGKDDLTINDKEYSAIIVSDRDPVNGMESTYWIDITSGLRLKMEAPTGISMFLSDVSVMSRLGIGNWDENIFIRTNKYIRDIRKISTMKVEAELEPLPSPTIESLNSEGQVFTGSISGKLVKGVFEVNQKRYYGADAQNFGSKASFGPEVAEYLTPDQMIQSDNPELVELAFGITSGSKDVWDATLRLSKWVEENIDGSIVFGSAYETFRRGEGACGSQSMLMAALCRAVGIPARVAWGALYIPEHGGGFGSHGWNEVYMGDKAGWVSLDVTLGEADYIDSGHIRLGIYKEGITLINYREMTILDYSLK